MSSSAPKFISYHFVKALGNYPQLQIKFITEGSPIYTLGYNGLFFCGIEDQCLKDHNFDIISGGITITGIREITSTSEPYYRTIPVQRIMSAFLSSTPKYFAIGFGHASHSQTVGIKVTGINIHSINLEVQVYSGAVFSEAILYYIASNWGTFILLFIKILDGLQTKYVNFLTEWVTSVDEYPSGIQVYKRTYHVPFTPSPEIQPIHAVISVTEYSSPTSFNLYFKAAEVDYVIIEGTYLPSVTLLAGYIIMYTHNLGKYVLL